MGHSVVENDSQSRMEAMIATFSIGSMHVLNVAEP